MSDLLDAAIKDVINAYEYLAAVADMWPPDDTRVVEARRRCAEAKSKLQLREAPGLE
jgi:hypothetical protein